jgi:D-proline reductase (dithiol) PrdB
MARLEELPEPMYSHLADLPCPQFERTPWTEGPRPSEQRVALVSTAGLHRRNDRPFTGRDGDYRVIPGKVSTNDLIMSHISTNFDRTGFQQDWNVVFPLERLQELALKGMIGSVADFHYSFMGATDPEEMAGPATNLAQVLHGDKVNAVLLVPV